MNAKNTKQTRRTKLATFNLSQLLSILYFKALIVTVILYFLHSFSFSPRRRFVFQTEISGKYIVIVLISLLFYFFSSPRRGDQSTVFCIVPKISLCGSRSPKYIEFSDFTSLFSRARQRNVQRFKTHVHSSSPSPSWFTKGRCTPADVLSADKTSSLVGQCAVNSDKPGTRSGLIGRYLTVLDLKTSCDQALSASVRRTKKICRCSRLPQPMRNCHESHVNKRLFQRGGDQS